MMRLRSKPPWMSYSYPRMRTNTRSLRSFPHFAADSERSQQGRCSHHPMHSFRQRPQIRHHCRSNCCSNCSTHPFRQRLRTHCRRHHRNHHRCHCTSPRTTFPARQNKAHSRHCIEWFRSVDTRQRRPNKAFHTGGKEPHQRTSNMHRRRSIDPDTRFASNASPRPSAQASIESSIQKDSRPPRQGLARGPRTN